MSYLMRPSGASLQRHAEFKAANAWTGPIVGVHVRRTDKLAAEAKLHQVDEYMRHVEYLCDQQLSSGWQERALKLTVNQPLLLQQEQRMAQAAAIAAGATPAAATAAAGGAANAAAASGGAAAAAAVAGQASSTAGVQKHQHSECSVYLASDEPAVAQEAREKYKHIHIITNDRALKSGKLYSCSVAAWHGYVYWSNSVQMGLVRAGPGADACRERTACAAKHLPLQEITAVAACCSLDSWLYMVHSRTLGAVAGCPERCGLLKCMQCCLARGARVLTC
jgi:hypothetical protein